MDEVGGEVCEEVGRPRHRDEEEVCTDAEREEAERKGRQRGRDRCWETQAEVGRRHAGRQRGREKQAQGEA